MEFQADSKTEKASLDAAMVDPASSALLAVMASLAADIFWAIFVSPDHQTIVNHQTHRMVLLEHQHLVSPVSSARHLVCLSTSGFQVIVGSPGLLAVAWLLWVPPGCPLGTP